MNKIAAKFAKNITTLRNKFDESKEVDAISRLQIVESLKTFQIDRPDSFDEKFVEAPGIQIVNGRKNNYVKVEGRGKGIRVVKLTARCDLEEAAAYFWDFESRANNSIGDLERKVEELIHRR